MVKKTIKPFSHHNDTDNIHIIQNKIIRLVVFSIGSLAWLLGILGIFLPLLPTTPFLLLATTCYAKSSRTFYSFIINNKWFGPYIYNWRKYKKIPRHAKYTAILVLIFTITISIYLIQKWIFKIMLCIIAIAVLIFLIRIPILTEYKGKTSN